MTEAVVSFVLRKLEDTALKKALELYHVNDQVEPMQLELRMIQSFLKDADSKGNQNPRVKQWVKEVREVAHRIEDAVDTFLVEIEENLAKNSSKSCGLFSKLKRLGKHPKKLSWFSDEIKSIQVTIKRIDEARIRLGMTDIGGGSEERSVAVVPYRPTKLHQIDVSEVVGFDADKKKILMHLLDRSISRRTVLSIIGIGGLGKTTLAQKVFKSSKLEGQFNCRAWLSISQKFNLTELLREILYSIDPKLKEKQEKVTDEDLPMKLNKFLSEKRYLIVLDNVWTTDLWEQLKITLPDMKNGSRVLITSRSLEVAKTADPKTLPHKLSYLKENESVALLLRKALPHERTDKYPPNIMRVAKQFAKKCDGLPLALIVLGGILLMRDPSAWPTIEQTIDWHNDKGEKCSQVLAMSYNNLPYYLKPCFLYFASFPEDYKISAKHVIRMWIAEGFIPKDGAGTLEDKAHDFLEELVQRCLVQVTEKNWNGYCKYCSMHDLLRDLAIHEAKDDNFLTVFSKVEDSRQLDARVVHRAVLQFCTAAEYGVLSKNCRSLLLFGQYGLDYNSGFRLLRVLAIERVHMSKPNEKWLKSLIHLKFLGFRYCGRFPLGFGRFSFSFLKNLETLDLKGTGIEDKPDHSLWEIPTLRHVISPYYSELTRGLSKWDHLKNLQTLKWVSLKNIPELGCDLNLREIGLRLDPGLWKHCGSDERAQHILKGLLKRMKLLVSLSIRSYVGCVPFPISGTSELPCHEKIQSLSLVGTWPKSFVLNVKMFPTNLTKLTLIDSWLEQDPMPILERLQSLKILRLWLYSYVGTELICSTGGFPSLEKLELRSLRNLLHWDIKERAMTELIQLTIEGCYMLDALPDLQNVPTLQLLIVYGNSDQLYERIQSEDLYKIKHIPSVRLGYWAA